MNHLLFDSFFRKPGLLSGCLLLMTCVAAAPVNDSTAISFYLNQAGFHREGPKLAVLQSDAALPSGTSFTVTDSATGKPAFSGLLQGPQKISDWAPGKWFYQADSSAIRKPGRYRIMITVKDKRYPSPGFTIAGNELTRQMISAIIHYYNRQRANTAVEWANDGQTDWWWQGENARLASLATAAVIGGRLVYPHPGGWGVKDALARFASEQVSWILGCNPYSICFMYQFGRKNVPYMQSNFGHGSEKGGISNGITGSKERADGSGIDFRTSDDGNEWRWTEQWIPHAAWFLQMLAATASGN